MFFVHDSVRPIVYNFCFVDVYSRAVYLSSRSPLLHCRSYYGVFVSWQDWNLSTLLFGHCVNWGPRYAVVDFFSLYFGSEMVFFGSWYWFVVNFRSRSRSGMLWKGYLLLIFPSTFSWTVFHLSIYYKA